MRLLFFVLLLVNALLLGYFLLRPQMAGPGAHSQLLPEAIRVVTEPPKPATTLQCYVWSGLSADDLEKAKAALAEAGFGDRLAVQPGREYWVHVPPFKTRAEAEKKLKELAALGLSDASVVEAAGPWQYALSIAAFETAADAESHLEALRQKGIKSARVVERESAPSRIEVKAVADAERDKLTGVATALGVGDLKPVACPAP